MLTLTTPRARRHERNSRSRRSGLGCIGSVGRVSLDRRPKLSANRIALGFPGVSRPHQAPPSCDRIRRLEHHDDRRPRRHEVSQVPKKRLVLMNRVEPLCVGLGQVHEPHGANPKLLASMRCMIAPTTCRSTASGLMMASVRCMLPKALHDCVEGSFRRAHAVLRQGGEWLLDKIEQRQKIVAARVDVDDPGRELTTRMRRVEHLERVDLVQRVVFLVEFLEIQLRSVVQLDLLGRPRLMINRDVFEERYELMSSSGSSWSLA